MEPEYEVRWADEEDCSLTDARSSVLGRSVSDPDSEEIPPVQQQSSQAPGCCFHLHVATGHFATRSFYDMWAFQEGSQMQERENGPVVVPSHSTMRDSKHMRGRPEQWANPVQCSHACACTPLCMRVISVESDHICSIQVSLEDSNPLTIVGIYMPSSDYPRETYNEYINAVSTILPSSPLMVVSDLNW